MKNIIIAFLILFFTAQFAFAGNSDSLLQQGWNELSHDNDTSALKYFALAYEQAQQEHDIENSATALLNIGISLYGISYSEGLHYCFRAMEAFKKLEKTDPQKALTGRSKCLQLISTIKARQGHYEESISLSREAMKGFAAAYDTTGYLGLIYSTMGEDFNRLNRLDSADYYHHLALTERIQTNNFLYLPGSYLSVAGIESRFGNKEKSYTYYNRAFFIADSTGNRQAQVLSLIGLGNWQLTFAKNETAAEANFAKAKEIAFNLSDKTFYLKVLQQYLSLNKKQGKFNEALRYIEEIQALNDTLATWEKDRITKTLEIQFDVAEKDRQLSIMQSEKDIASLTNYLLWISIGFLILIATGIILFLKKINRRDKLLIKTKEELVTVIEEKKKLKEQQMLNELEFKESQLNSLTFRMLQKNELLLEMKERLEQDNGAGHDNHLDKIISKGLNQDKEWSDFNSSFESLNKNFYGRLKVAYPDISPNDLKICALIKMNLSIKEMAGILNISADSVKTARYRLRKKLQLKSEDNLTDFILNL